MGTYTKHEHSCTFKGPMDGFMEALLQAGLAGEMVGFARDNGTGFPQLKLALEQSGFSSDHATRLAGEFMGFKPIFEQLKTLDISYTSGLFAKEEKGIGGPVV